MFNHPGLYRRHDEAFDGQDYFGLFRKERCTLPRAQLVFEPTSQTTSMLGNTLISGNRNRIVSGRNDGCTCKKRGDNIEAASNFAHYADNALMMRAFQPRRETGEGGAPLPVVVREGHRKPGEVKSVVDEEGKDLDAEGRNEQGANIQQEEVGEKPVSMQDQLMEMFANTGDFRTTVLGMRLCRS